MRQVEGLQSVARGLDERSQASQRLCGEMVVGEVEINQSQVSTGGEGVLQTVGEKSEAFIGKGFARHFQVEFVKSAVFCIVVAIVAISVLDLESILSRSARGRGRQPQ